MWKFKFAKPNQCQLLNKVSVVGFDLASVLGLEPADAKSIPTPEIWCRFGTDLASDLGLKPADTKSMPTPVIWCRFGTDLVPVLK